MPHKLYIKQPIALFLDTEWADDGGRELVSLALVYGGPYGLFTNDSTDSFYAERDPLPLPNDFVSSTVYPRLDRGECAMSDVPFSRALGTYLTRCTNPDTKEGPVVIATHANDFELLRGMLAIAHQQPAYTTELRFSESLREAIRAQFASDPGLAQRRHHALIDATVLQRAYREWFKIGKPRMPRGEPPGLPGDTNK